MMDKETLVQVLNEYLNPFRAEMMQHFGQIEMRLEQVETKIGQIDVRLGQVEVRLEHVENKVTETKEICEALRYGQTGLSAKVDGLDKKILILQARQDIASSKIETVEAKIFLMANS